MQRWMATWGRIPASPVVRLIGCSFAHGGDSCRPRQDLKSHWARDVGEVAVLAQLCAARALPSTPAAAHRAYARLRETPDAVWNGNHSFFVSFFDGQQPGATGCWPRAGVPGALGPSS